MPRLAYVVLGTLLVLTSARSAHAQRLPISLGTADSAALALALPTLAHDALARYADRDTVRALDTRFRLQIVAGQFDEAARSIAQVRALRARRARDAASRTQALASDAQYEMWARAMAASTTTRRPVTETYAEEFRRAFAGFDNGTAALVLRALSVRPAALEDALRQAVERHRNSGEIELGEAVVLLRAYQRVLSHASVRTMLPPLFNEDDARRYVTERNVRVRTPDGGTVCALVVRPRPEPTRGGAPRQLPTLLTFTIYVDSATDFAEARRAAANDYVGVVGYTRGKACSADVPMPYVYDGRDAAALIDWIATQSWSDGQVGMYGGSYSGFTAWAAAKYMPKALKAIMVGAAVAPGLDVPAEGNIVWNFIYPWPFYTTNNKTLDNATYFDGRRWSRLNREWYVSGRAYRDLPKIDGTPNPVFEEWIRHPSYDAFWQRLIPFGDEFARVTIPVLQTAGYYFGGPGAAAYYFTQHVAHVPNARHYLVIGPYDHIPAQRGVVNALGDTATMLAGYELDPVARLDLVAELRYRWFDWTLRGGPRPALLEDRVNYEVTGLNRWRHAPSIQAMATQRLRLYLTPNAPGRTQRLSTRPGPPDSSVALQVDLRKRSDVDSMFAGGGIRDTAINAYEALTFVSDPLEGMELSGLFSGHLSFVTNKRDFDLSVSLFELTRNGEYFQLPPFQIRASYARDLTSRQLLTPGVRQTLNFRSIRLMSRRFAPGSRIVAVIGPLKWPGQQINYGSGKDVNDETIADAGAPLELRWFGSSYIDLPVRR